MILINNPSYLVYKINIDKLIYSMKGFEVI